MISYEHTPGNWVDSMDLSHGGTNSTGSSFSHPKSCHFYRVYHEQTQDHHKARGFFKAHRASQKNPAGPVVILWGLSQLFCCWLCWLNYHRTTIANTTRLNYPLWVLLPTGMRKNLLPSIRRSYRVLEVNTPNPGQTLTPQPGQHLTTG